MSDTFDLVIIGAGAAGLIAARFAAKTGARVAIIDKSRIGGDCTWTGCVPSKALIHCAKIAHTAKTGGTIGVETGRLTVDWQKVKWFLESAIDDVYRHSTPEGLEKEGIKVFFGDASFKSHREIDLGGGRSVSGKNFLICVGAVPTKPKIAGIEAIDYVTYLDLFDLREQPKSLIVVGGGPIGLEMSQAFNRLGTNVTLVDKKIFAREEPEVGGLMQGVFESEGVHTVFGHAESVERGGDGVVVNVGERRVIGERLLVSTGRSPSHSSLNLEAAGVAYSSVGVQVDECLRTTARNIFAAGDCIGGYQFSHYAGWQAFQAVRTALFVGSGRGKSDTVPWCTFTDPEVARVGPLESEARWTYGTALTTTLLSMKDVDRAVCDDDLGFIKLLTVGTKIIGASIVASRAGEMINEMSLAISAGVRADRLAGSIHAYPTYNTAIQLMAMDVAVDSFLAGPLGSLAMRLSGLTPRGKSVDTIYRN